MAKNNNIHPNRIFKTPEYLEIKRPDVDFELPLKKVDSGLYLAFPNKRFIGGKNQLRKLAASKVKVGWVYLIRIAGTNKCKIGVSSNPRRRFADIYNIMPFELEVLALNEVDNPYVIEQGIIDDYRDNLIKNEWFNLSIHDMKEIMIYLHNKQVEDSILLN